MSDITGLQMAEYLNIGPSPYTLLFQQIFDILKPELKVVEAKDIEDGEIEETEDEEEDKDVIIVDDDDNNKDIGETGDQEVSHGKPCVATAELPPVSLAGLPPPTSQPNPSLFTLGLPFPLGFPAPSFSFLGSPFLISPEAFLPFPPPQSGRVMHPLSGKVPADEKAFREAKGFDLKVLYGLDTNPERLSWLDSYMEFMISKGKPVTQCPSMYKVRAVSSDLYRFIYI